MGHDGGHHSARLANGEHMLGEHQVAFFPSRRRPTPAEPLSVLHISARIILAEGRIGDDAIKAFKLARLAVHRVKQGVLELYVGAGHAMQQHVQLADGPRRGVVHLATKADIGGIAAGLLNKLAADDEHAAGTAARIVNAQARLRLENADHQPDNVARGIEVAAFFACRFGEHIDEKFIGGAKEVGKLKVFVSQPIFAEKSNEIFAGVVRNDTFIALYTHEADVVENVFERVVMLGQRGKSFVEHAAIRFFRVTQLILEIGPAGALGDKKLVIEIRVLAVLGLGFFLNHSLFDFGTNDLLSLSIENIRAAFQEKHSENVVFVRSGIQSF